MAGSLSEIVKAYIRMLRPEISFMDITLPASAAMLSYFFVTSLTGDPSFPPLIPFLLATIGGYFAITSSYIFNDCFDVDIDEINLPDRPLPAGIVSRRSAIIYASVLALISALISLWLSIESFVVLVIAVSVITLYSWYFKRNTPFSFLPVGVAYGLVPVGIWLAFVPAGILVPAPEGIPPEYLTSSGFFMPLPAIFFGLMICMTDWGFTLAGVCRDVVGDRLRGAPTLPVTYGIPKTSVFIMIIWIIGIILSTAIGISAKLGPIYFAAALLSGLWMLRKCYSFIKNPEPALGGKLFVNGSNYRGIMFSAMIIDIIVNVLLSGYHDILWQ